MAVRSTETPGDINVTVRGAGLKPAAITIHSKIFATENGYALQMPPLPPPPVLARPVMDDAHALIAAEEKVETGRFLAAFSSSGPTAAVSVQKDAQDGARIYADRDFVFNGLPETSVRGKIKVIGECGQTL